MLTKQGMLSEDVRIQVGNRSYHNLAHYSPNVKFTGPSIYGAFNSFTPEIFQYDESGKPDVAKFMPAFAGVGNATRRIKIPISRMREEISELERELSKSEFDPSNFVLYEEKDQTIEIGGEVFINKGYSFRINEQAERISELIKQRRDFLDMYVDVRE